MKNFAAKTLFLFDRKEKRRAVVLFFAMLFGAILEATGVALIFPLIALVSNPAVIEDYRGLRWLHDVSGVSSAGDFSVWLVTVVFVLYVFKYIYLSLLYHFQYRFILDCQAALSVRLFNAYLRSPYAFHLQRNSAKLITNVNTNVPLVFSGIVIPAFYSMIEILIVGTILLVLLVMLPVPTIAAIVVLGGAGVGFYSVVKRRSAVLGKIQQEHFVQMMKWANQGLGGIKEVKILGREKFFLNEYAEHSFRSWRASSFIRTLGDVSRLFIEGLMICSVLLVVGVMLWLRQDVQTLIPALGLFAVAAIRLMPSANRILYGITNLRYYTAYVDEVYQDYKDLENFRAADFSSGDASAEIAFGESIRLENVAFRYAESEATVLRGVNLSIEKNQSVAFIGSSGAGKTTLIDIILGLLEPTGGRVLVDGADIKTNLAAWQRKIGYIPQPVYLSDDTIARNVAFGVENAAIDEAQVWKSLRAAQLEDFAANLPNRLETMVGENGVSLSGGQRQRIGIARALYHNPEVLVLDEATAALDNETESEVTKAIEALGGTKTIIAIAHRLTTVKNFDCLFFMKDGQIVDAADYESLIERNRDFRKMADPTFASSESIVNLPYAAEIK